MKRGSIRKILSSQALPKWVLHPKYRQPHFFEGVRAVGGADEHGRDNYHENPAVNAGISW
jgi:hypothetical protein